LNEKLIAYNRQQTTDNRQRIKEPFVKRLLDVASQDATAAEEDLHPHARGSKVLFACIPAVDKRTRSTDLPC